MPRMGSTQPFRATHVFNPRHGRAEAVSTPHPRLARRGSPTRASPATVPLTPQIKAVVSVVGRDQKGVVARFATYLAEHGINIEDIQQQVVHGQFVMDMLVDLADMTISLDR